MEQVLIKLCVASAFFVGFTGGLEGRGAPRAAKQAWEDAEEADLDREARERTFAALSDCAQRLAAAAAATPLGKKASAAGESLRARVARGPKREKS